MRVAHVTATFPPYQGGTGTVCFYNARELARLGHEVTVFTAATPGADAAGPAGVQVERLPTAFQVGNAPLMPGLLRRLGGYDLIHLHCPFIFGGELVWAASRRTRTPYVVTHHNDLIGNGLREPLFRAYSAISSRLVYGGARKVAAVSLDHARSCRLAPLLRRRWADVVDVPNGVDTELFRPLGHGPALRQKLEIAPDAPVVLFVGALDRAHHFKGADHLLRAFSRLEKQEAVLLVVGEGDLRPGLERLATELQVADRTRFVGSVPHENLAPLYAAADLLVLPSFPPESFGLVIVEALACGRPVIAHDIPGVRTLVRPGVDGFLARPGDLDDLVAKIDMLVASPELRRALGEQGRSKVEAHYAWPRVASRLVTVYEEVLADDPSGR